MNATAHPLSWPFGRPRTAHRKRAPFGSMKRLAGRSHETRESLTVGEARSRLQDELDRLGARSIVLSTNLELRLDGLPRSGQAEPRDPGAACYFKLDGRDTLLACDTWDRVADNIAAIAKHIEALRGMDRWGVGTLEQAFAGYQALPAPGADRPARPWRDVLHWQDGDSTLEDLNRRYRERAKVVQGDETALLELNLARDDARRELGQ